MENTLGMRIAEYRKRAGMTQEQLAETMEVTPQAVSKWENDLTCPDIAALPKLSGLFRVSVDTLLKGETLPETRMLSPEERKEIGSMLLRIRVHTAAGDRVKVNLPVELVRVALEIGLELPQFDGQEVLRRIDLEKIIRLVDEGVIGKLVEVQTEAGDNVEIAVS